MRTRRCIESHPFVALLHLISSSPNPSATLEHEAQQNGLAASDLSHMLQRNNQADLAAAAAAGSGAGAAFAAGASMVGGAQRRGSSSRQHVL
jgi:hypothetical protein